MSVFALVMPAWMLLSLWCAVVRKLNILGDKSCVRLQEENPARRRGFPTKPWRVCLPSLIFSSDVTPLKSIAQIVESLDRARETTDRFEGQRAQFAGPHLDLPGVGEDGGSDRAADNGGRSHGIDRALHRVIAVEKRLDRKFASQGTSLSTCRVWMVAVLTVTLRPVMP